MNTLNSILAFFPKFKSTQKKHKLQKFIILCCRSLRAVKTCLWVSGSWCASPALYSGRQRSQSRSTHFIRKWQFRIMWTGVSMVCGYHTVGVGWSGELPPNEAEGCRGLAQHAGPLGWLESDPAGCDSVPDGRSMPPAPHHLPWSGFDRLLNVPKTPSWATSRKEGMAWYSSRPMTSLWLSLYSNQWNSAKIFNIGF